jgi:hypothetical protein
VCIGGWRIEAEVPCGWLAGVIDDEPDRARFEVALERRPIPVLRALSRFEVLEADHNEDLRVGALDVSGPVGVGRSHR